MIDISTKVIFKSHLNLVKRYSKKGLLKHFNSKNILIEELFTCFSKVNILMPRPVKVRYVGLVGGGK